MSVITTGAHPKALWPGIKYWFGREYNQYPVEWTDLFDDDTSDKAYEEVPRSVGFGLARVKTQGGPIYYDADQQGETQRFTHVAYALGFIITHEERRDNLYMDVAKRRAPDLAFSMRQTKETVLANIYNRAFDTNYTFGDSKALIVSDHPSLAGNQSNVLSAAADLSETALEDMVIQVNTAQDYRGKIVSIKAQSLHIAPQNEFEAIRILKSVQQNDTANNAVNALRTSGALPKGIKMNHFFSDPDAWFLRTDARRGMIHFQRDPLEFGEDGDFDTKNIKYAAYERYSAGPADWLGVFGTPGA